MNDRPTPDGKAISKPAAQMARSAKAVERSSVRLTQKTDRRTTLAGDRTLLAAERTYAAWVRTGLAALASGVGARALFTAVLSSLLAKLTATVLIAFAAMCFVIAVWRQLRDGVPPPQTDLRPVPYLALVAMNALLLCVALATLAGVWAHWR